MSEMIQEMAFKMEDKKEERRARREELRKQRIEETEETPAQRRKRERQERLAKKEEERLNKEKEQAAGEQIKINFGGRLLDGQEEQKGLKKYDHSKDDLEPLTKKSREEVQPDVLENNLFRQVEEEKQE